MSQRDTSSSHTTQTQPDETPQAQVSQPLPPLTNYTLSSVCPACGEEMFRLACKVRCKRCGFMWDCSEL